MEEEKKWCVYIHRNKINDKAYIGITCHKPESRWGINGKRYKEKQKVFYNAIQKYGWDNFEHIIWAESLTEKEAKEWEVRLIALFNTNCCRYKTPECGYNMTDGGEGIIGHEYLSGEKHPMYGKHHSEETREKIKLANKGRFSGEKNPMYGRPRSDEEKKKISDGRKGKTVGENNPMYGKHHSKEARDKMSNVRKGKNTGKDNPFYGKKHSEESKEKMRNYALNRPPEVNKKIGEAMKGKPSSNKGKIYSDEIKQHMRDGNKSKISVVQLSNTNEYISEYESSKQAYRETGIDAASIRRACLHIQKTAGGFQWMNKEEYEKLINGGNNNE